MSFDVNSFHHSLDMQKYEIVATIFPIMAGKCPFCGQQLLVNTKSCSYCGAELTNTPTFTPSSAPPPQSISIDMQNATQGGQPMQQMQAVTTQMGIPQAIPGQQMPNMYGQIGVLGGATIMSARPATMMSFMDSVKTCMQKYASFEGRASRSEYWWFYFAYFIALIPAGIVDSLVFGIELNDPTWFTWGLQLALALPILAAGIRRIHDHGKSGWFILIPFYNLILLIFEGEAIPNTYGPVPTNKL